MCCVSAFQIFLFLSLCGLTVRILSSSDFVPYNHMTKALLCYNPAVRTFVFHHGRRDWQLMARASAEAGLPVSSQFVQALQFFSKPPDEGELERPILSSYPPPSLSPPCLFFATPQIALLCWHFDKLEIDFVHSFLPRLLLLDKQ